MDYFIDEAGDGTLWNRRGKCIIGTPGCSRYFIMGLVHIAEPKALTDALESLRQEILNDPYFRNVPSVKPDARKTAICFHAKDDLPEVRRDVFRLLLSHDLTFHAVVRDKQEVARIVTMFGEVNPTYTYHPNHLYDNLARRLLKDKLHAKDGYKVIFARRGNIDRTAALRSALEKARDRWCQEHSIEVSPPPVTVDAAYSHENAGLQVVDYFLWALQRLYEKGEDRYVQLMWPKFHCVWDCDDTILESEGVYYTKEKPLNAASLFHNAEI